LLPFSEPLRAASYWYGGGPGGLFDVAMDGGGGGTAWEWCWAP